MSNKKSIKTILCILCTINYMSCMQHTRNQLVNHDDFCMVPIITHAEQQKLKNILKDKINSLSLPCHIKQSLTKKIENKYKQTYSDNQDNTKNDNLSKQNLRYQA